MPHSDRVRCRARPVRQHGIAAGDVYPVRLRRDAGAEIESDLDVAIVSSDHGHALIFWRILHLVDERTIAQCCLGQARVCTAVQVDCSSCTRLSSGTLAAVAGDGFPHSGRAGDQMTAPAAEPAGRQSSPPGMPPWKISIGRTNDC